MGRRWVLELPSGWGTLRTRLVLVAAFALAARLAWLDRRAIHFDEARVGVVLLRYVETGEWLYSPALHGPLLFHADRALFSLLGPSDLVFRLPVAVVGGLLPLVALLYRDHLTDAEVVALGVLLAVDPLLLYYGRFARNDLLVAAFAAATLGFGLRLLATGRARYLYAGTAAFALALASKENALLYLLCWAGAGGVLLAARPDLRAQRGGRSAAEIGSRVRRWTLPAGVAAVELVALVVAFYAPRGGEGPRLALLGSIPGALATIEAATIGSACRVVGLWVLGGGHAPSTYAVHLALLLGFLLVLSVPVVAAAAIGSAAERRGVGRPRPLVGFCLLWAGLSVVGYPYASDIVAGWTAVHVVLPLSIPAAVGLAATYGVASGSRTRLASRVAARALFAGAALLLSTAVLSSFVVPGAPYNPIGQPGQPTAEFRDTVETIERVARDHPGTDVAYAGPFYADDPLWRVPFRWYLDRAGGTTVVGFPPGDDPPPVVIVLDREVGPFRDALSGYVCVEVDPYPWGAQEPGGPLAETIVFVDRSALPPDVEGWRDPGACGPGPSRPRPLASALAAGL